MGDLLERLKAALDEDERVALAASAGRHGMAPNGEHWRWECSSCDTPIEITPMVVASDEVLRCPNCGSYGVGLRSVESYEYEYSTGHRSSLPHLVTHSTEEMVPVDALHIARHDPARVLRWVAAAREVLERHGPNLENVEWPHATTPDGRAMVCKSCHPKEPTEGWDRADWLPEWFVPSYVLWPCPDVRALAGVYGIGEG